VTVVQDEAAWLAADATVAANLTVVAYARQPPPAGIKRASLWRERLVEKRLDIGHKELVHHFVLSIAWPQTSGAAKPQDDQERLDTAVDAVRARLRSTADHTHGGLFVSVAEDGPDGPEIEARWTVDPTTVTDPATDLAAFKVEIRYAATQVIVA
jgi:hypothetical protein